MTDRPNIHQRLAAAMAEVSYIQKEHKKGMQYRIVSHDAVTAKVRPALLAQGIVYYPVRCDHTHIGNRAECSMTVRFVNIDEPADHFDVPTFGYGIDNQDKGPGKAMSYAVKYALLKALGLETGDDPDTEDIDHSREDPARPTVSVEQFVQLRDKCKEAGVPPEKVCAVYGAPSLEEFPAANFQRAVKKLNATINVREEADTQAFNRQHEPNAADDIIGDEIPY
jgi:hypothetical protein